MARPSTEPPVRRAVSLPAPANRAFVVFTVGMGSWWPAELTASHAAGSPRAFETVVVEPWEGGRWFERTHDGRELDWGRVLHWEPPRRVILRWQLAPDGRPEPRPSQASEIEARFLAAGPDSTRLELEHRALGRHGEANAARWRATLESLAGWTGLLERFRAALG